MRIVFMGTNGWFDTETGHTISILVDMGDSALVLDAGSGIRKLDRQLDAGVPVYLFLSHFHLDHISGLHILPKFRFSKPLRVLLPEGGREVMARIQAQPFTAPPELLPYPVEYIELPADTDKLPFGLTVLPLVHSSLTLGLRLEAGGKILSYIPDTGFCANAVELSRGADLVIAECAYKPGQTDPSWPHLNPQEAARIAREAGARRLALVHFDAVNYPTLDDRRAARDCARETFPETEASLDDLIIVL